MALEDFMTLMDKGTVNIKFGRFEGSLEFDKIVDEYDLILGAEIAAFVDRTPEFNRRSMELLTNGTKLWPHPATLVLHSCKSIMEGLLAETIEAAGGFAVRATPVNSKEQGIQFLQDGWVIRRDNSCEGRNVYLPAADNPDHAVFQGTLRQMKLDWDETEKQRAKGHGYAKCSLLYAAYPYNIALRSLGECRIYFVFGKIVEIKHTVPSTCSHSNFTGTSAYGRLNAVETIKRATQ